MERFSNKYSDNVAYMDTTLGVGESFDIIKRDIGVANESFTFYYIDGFIKDGVMQRLMQYFAGLKGFESMTPREFANRHVPYVEVDVTDSPGDAVRMVLSGAAVIFCTAWGDGCIVVDARTYPARTTQEPENDRVMQGARDGFVETLIFNTALLRRRIRDPRLTVTYVNLGGISQTDVAVCYMKGIADGDYVKAVIKRLREIRPTALTLGMQSVAECLIPRRWYNPFPKIRTTERPDAASSQLVEGSVLVMIDTSPQVMILPTSIFDFLQETDDYYNPPVTGTYLRVVRLLIFLASFFLAPTWYLLVQHTEWLPPWLGFVIPEERGELPLIVQLYLAELAIDGLKLASMNTPNLLSNSLSVIGGLILGEFAVTIGWLSPDVIFYMAVVAIAGFSQQNHELSYAVKFLRMITLGLTAILGLWGYLGGVVLSVVLVVTNRTFNGKYSYLYPLIPWNGRAMKRLLFRVKKEDYRKEL